MAKENGLGNCTGFTGLLTIAFIVLKLTGEIDWSWWWVLAPVWISFILWVLFHIIYIVCRNYK